MALFPIRTGRSGRFGRTGFVVTWLAGLVLAGPAVADTPERAAAAESGGWFSAADPVGRRGEAVPAAAITALIDWIDRHTDYDVTETRTDAPEVVFAWSGAQIPYEHGEITVGPSLRAAYDEEHRRIHLVRPWKVAFLRDRSTLLHELIHDVQSRNRSWPCAAKSEWEAYKLQAAWLAEHGVDAGFNWLQIFFLSRCRRDIHP
jgi:hypothetical protein